MDLYQAINQLSRWLADGVENDFMTPSAFALLAASAANEKKKEVSFSNPAVNSYASTIGFHTLLNGLTNGNVNRPNLGQTYSKVTLLKSKEEVDSATQTVADCIKHQLNLLPTPPPEVFVADLIKVIGELHDNVWSHGQRVGASMAQIYSVQGQKHIELAVADCGIGFFRELRSKGINVDNAQEAIDWCLSEGNTSKRAKEDDGWSQKLPEDSIGSPMNISTTHQDQANHHQGLGLHLLEKLAKNSHGSLCIASGDSLVLTQNGYKKCCTIPYYSGVAISCRFTLTGIMSYSRSPSDLPLGTDRIIGRIKNST